MTDQNERLAHRAHDNHWAHFQSLHKARIADARAAVRAGLLINGGAATAMLAFMGSATSRTTLTVHVPRALIWSLSLFASGVLFAAAAATCAYLANHRYAEATRAQTLSYKHPFKADTIDSQSHQQFAEKAHVSGILANGLSLAAFLAGVVAAAKGFTTMH